MSGLFGKPKAPEPPPPPPTADTESAAAAGDAERRRHRAAAGRAATMLSGRMSGTGGMLGVATKKLLGQ